MIPTVKQTETNSKHLINKDYQQEELSKISFTKGELETLNASLSFGNDAGAPNFNTGINGHGIWIYHHRYDAASAAWIDIKANLTPEPGKRYILTLQHSLNNPFSNIENSMGFFLNEIRLPIQENSENEMSFDITNYLVSTGENKFRIRLGGEDNPRIIENTTYTLNHFCIEAVLA